MKHLSHLFLAVALVATPCIFTSCDDDDDKQQAFTASFESATLNDDGFWIGEENDRGYDNGYGMSYPCTFTDGLVTLNTTYSVYYWSGFALSSRTATGFDNLTPDQYNNVVGKAHSGNKFIVATTYGETIDINVEGGAVVESLWYTNSSYTVNSILNGDGYAGEPFKADDWLSCTFVGTHADGTTASVEVKLAENGTYVNEWKKVNLRPLGKITALSLSFDGSRKNQYGLLTPSYICLDDIKVVTEK